MHQGLAEGYSNTAQYSTVHECCTRVLHCTEVRADPLPIVRICRSSIESTGKFHCHCRHTGIHFDAIEDEMRIENSNLIML